MFHDCQSQKSDLHNFVSQHFYSWDKISQPSTFSENLKKISYQSEAEKSNILNNFKIVISVNPDAVSFDNNWPILEAKNRVKNTNSSKTAFSICLLAQIRKQCLL